MLTTWNQVQEWITDNGFKRWVIYKDATRTEKILDSAAFTVSDQADKLAMTEKYLRQAGGRAYAAGAQSGATSDLSTTCEIRLQEQPTQGVGGGEAFNIGELRESIMREVKATMELENLKKREAEVERREKELEEERKSAIGAIIHYLAPMGQQLIARKMMPKVAGLDADEPVHADPITIVPRDNAPEAPEEQDATGQQGQDDFTEEESQELYALLVRFKKAEPDYLPMLRKVVAMAEAGDATYTMAKGFLVS